MGSSYGVECRECSYAKEFMLGVGMMYSPGNLLDFDSEFAMLPSLIRSKKTVQQIRELVEEKEATLSEDYGHKVFRCPKCGQFYGRFYIRLEYPGGSYDVEYKCSRCKKKLEPVPEYGGEDDWSEQLIDLTQFPCPQCGKHSLTEMLLLVMWD